MISQRKLLAEAPACAASGAGYVEAAETFAAQLKAETQAAKDLHDGSDSLHPYLADIARQILGSDYEWVVEQCPKDIPLRTWILNELGDNRYTLECGDLFDLFEAECLAALDLATLH